MRSKSWFGWSLPRVDLRLAAFSLWFLWTLACVPTRSLAAPSDSTWPQFRGPGGCAVAGGSKAPVHFGPNTNVLWKIVLPPGHSSPCIWEQRIFLTAFDQGRLGTICLDRRNGSELWRRTAPVTKIEPTHRIASPASSTPATDGQRVYVYFGSFGLLCYDLEGHLQWQLPLPIPLVEFGTGTSPIVVGDSVLLLCDQDQNSFLLAVDGRTGNPRWRTERPEFRRGFATPFLWRHDGDEELIVPGSIWLRSYDPRNGAERWSYTGTSRVASSSPAAGDGLLFSASWNVGGDSGHRIRMEPFQSFARENDRNHDGKLTRAEIPPGPVRDRFNQMDLNKDGLVTSGEWGTMAEMFDRAGNAVLAIRPGGQGDITATHLAWKSTRSLPYVCSPVYYQGRLYTVKNGGLASCYEAKTGRVHYQDERLGAGGDYYASLIAAAGKIYAASQNGVVVVWEAGDTLNVLARNKLDEPVMATPAMLDGNLYLRTAEHFYAFGGRH
jgi:outer membrane protein assembly factor BamB